MSYRNTKARVVVAAPSRGDTVLDSYYRDVAAHALLSVAEEQRLSGAIRVSQVQAWVELMSFPRATNYVLDQITSRVELAEADAEPLRCAAAAAIETRRVSEKRRLTVLARAFAEIMRELDPDRRCFDAVVEHLQQLQTGRNCSGKRLPFSARSKAFAAHMDRVTSAHRNAAVARRKFVEANLRLVLTFARKHQGRGVPLSDLIQEGNLGLIKAVDRFDHRRGYRFSTFASWWIRHMLGREVANTSRTVRVPVHVQDTQQRIATARRLLRDKLERMPTDAEVAEAADVSVERIADVFQKVYGGVVSLDAPIGDDEGRSRGDVFRDPASEERTAFDAVSLKYRAERVRALLAQLPPVQGDVLRKRFGLEDGRCWTLREIGVQRKLTRERIRQIQVAALARLRNLAAR